jgi:hypothetical protein
MTARDLWVAAMHGNDDHRCPPGCTAPCCEDMFTCGTCGTVTDRGCEFCKRCADCGGCEDNDWIEDD